MIGAIPNPTKSITIDFPIERVKNSVKNIDKRMQFCHFREGNDMFNYYKFSRNEFLSMGVFINVNLTSISNTRTQINIEITRKMGAFDEWVEVTKANKHMEETINSIANNIQYGIPVVNTQPTKVESSDSAWSVIFGTLLGIGLLFGFFWVISLMYP
jgi:hypothetical protein